MVKTMKTVYYQNILLESRVSIKYIYVMYTLCFPLTDVYLMLSIPSNGFCPSTCLETKHIMGIMGKSAWPPSDGMTVLKKM